MKVFDDANIKVKENTLDRAERVLANTSERASRIEKVADARSALNNANNTNTAAGALTGNVAQATSNTVRKFMAPASLNVGGVKIKDFQMVQDNFPKPIPILPIRFN